MNPYELMLKTNHYMIQGGALTLKQKQSIAKQLIAALEAGYAAKYEAENGRKAKTILLQAAKTKILSENMLELEMLRLPALFTPEQPEVKGRISSTLKRLSNTCFGFQDDGVGECFDASLVVLRFLSAANPQDTVWIKSRIENYNRHKDEKKRSWQSKWYFWLCLSELPFALAEPELSANRLEIMRLLASKRFQMNTETGQQLNPVLLCILRNAIAQYREYEYLRERTPIPDKDGRLYFPMQ